MLEAKSMYRGGEIVSALDIESYEEPKQLGLVCPFCSEALFLNSGGVRKRGDKMQFVNPHFSHYKCGVSGLDCEKRSHTAEGKKRIAAIKAEARNQRLKLYNMYLWQMMAEDRNISNQLLGRTASKYGRKLVEETAIAMHRHLHKFQSDFYTITESAFVSMMNTKASEMLLQLGKENDWLIEEAIGQQQYFNAVDKKLHLAICHEIVDFLCTPSSGNVFHKMFIANLRVVDVTIYPDKLNLQNADSLRKVKFSIAGFIAGTRWIDQIQKRLAGKV